MRLTHWQWTPRALCVVWWKCTPKWPVSASSAITFQSRNVGGESHLESFLPFHRVVHALNSAACLANMLSIVFASSASRSRWQSTTMLHPSSQFMDRPFSSYTIKRREIFDRAFTFSKTPIWSIATSPLPRMRCNRSRWWSLQWWLNPCGIRCKAQPRRRILPDCRRLRRSSYWTATRCR